MRMRTLHASVAANIQRVATVRGGEWSRGDRVGRARKLAKATTTDPFSGQPLKLKHTDEGWVVYSVMQNGADDGGNFIDLKDFGVAPRQLRRTNG